MFVADIAWRRQGPRVQRLEFGNLARVLGPDATGKEQPRCPGQAMRNYTRYWLEVFRLPVISAGADHGRDHCTGEERLRPTWRPAAACSSRCRTWATGSRPALVIVRGAGSFTTVVERLKPEALFHRFLAFREGLGMEVLPATGGASPFGILAQRLRAGRLVCLVSDRDVTGGGIEVEFFGEKARMMPGPAALAVQTGAALLPVTLWFEDSGWGAQIYDEIPVPPEGTRREKVAAMTQQLAEVYEAGIRAHPQDWHMLQPVFTADLDLDRLARAEAREAAAGPARGEDSAPVGGGGP